MGLSERHPSIRKAKRRGLIPPAPKEEPPPPRALVAASFTPWSGIGQHRSVWVVPLVTASETNMRNWKARSARTKAARQAVSKAFGPTLGEVALYADWWHAGNPLVVIFTRLGGHKLDRGNLPAALKHVEDFVGLVMGADDGDDRWLSEYRQEPTGPCGVRIELAIPEGKS